VLDLRNLDEEARAMMRSEVEADVADEALDMSPRLSASGRAEYPTLLLETIDRGTDVSLANELRRQDRLNETEMVTRKGKTFSKKVPVNAAETLAEGEFNRFYARGLCRRAIAENKKHVRVYRAKDVTSPRADSAAMLGTLIEADALLDDVRRSVGVEPALGLPPGPNSGLSVELP
jgi:hypothetical protein